MKKFCSVLKIMANFIPALALGGCLAGFTCCYVSGNNLKNQVYEELKQEQVVQDLIETETQKIQEKYDEEEISYKEYQDSLNYLDSKDFLNDILKTSPEIEQQSYNEKLSQANHSQDVSYGLILPTIISVAAFGIWYFPDKGESFAGESIRDEISNLRTYMKEDKNKKRQKKLEQEFEEYNEEVEK